MKNIKLLLCFLPIVLLSITSCKKDKEESPAPTPTEQTVDQKIAKKWIVGSNSGRITTTDYLWFEFNSDNIYIIAKNDGSVISDKYTISSDKKTITLVNFGVITITSIDATNFTFTLTLDGSSTSITIFSTEGATTATSAKTDMLCRTWKLTKIIMSTDTITIPGSYYKSAEVIFSKYGTYFITKEYTDTLEATTYFSKNWKWTDSSESGFCYGLEPVVCGAGNEVIITEINASSMKMNEDGAIYLLTAK